MKTFEEFMASIARKRENPEEKKSEIGGGLTTSDNKKVDDNCFNSVKMILAGCSKFRIRNLGMDELFDRLTENFIKANTEEDIKHFVSHNIALKLEDFLMR